jgi:putative ABC transport system substrate-binding protein
MKRREIITLLGSAAAWPLAASAQQSAMPVVGFMSARSPEDSEHLVEGFRRGQDEIADRVARDRTNAARERSSDHEAQRLSN